MDPEVKTESAPALPSAVAQPPAALPSIIKATIFQKIARKKNLSMARHGRDEHRYQIAEKAVQAGRTIPQAMREAGYSEHTAKQSLKYPVKQALLRAKEKYMMQYISVIKKEKIDGKSTAKRLAKIIHGNDDYNANQAIKTHVMILLKNAPTDTQSNGIIGLFVVPENGIGNNWQSEAKTVEAIQVKALIGNEKAA